MTRPRKHQISLDATAFYHITCRCVRRAFLCGVDDYDGRSYEYCRKQIQEDLLRLGSIFYFDIRHRQGQASKKVLAAIAKYFSLTNTRSVSPSIQSIKETLAAGEFAKEYTKAGGRDYALKNRLERQVFFCLTFLIRLLNSVTAVH